MVDVVVRFRVLDGRLTQSDRCAKLDTLAGRERESGGPACWWGTIFEDVLAVVVGDDLGAPVVGDDICIQRFQGYRNSPDGYVVARLRSEGGTDVLPSAVGP